MNALALVLAILAGGLGQAAGTGTPVPAPAPPGASVSASDAPAPPPALEEPASENPVADYMEEALRQSAERARELAGRHGAEWPGFKIDAVRPPLSAETQSRLVLDRMMAAKDPGIRLRGLEGWVVANAWDTVHVLIEALADPSPVVAEYAAKELARLGTEDPEVARLLHRYVLDTLVSQNARLRGAVTAALSALRPVLEEPMLLTLQSDSEESGRRAAAAYCLGEMASVDAAAALSRCAWSEDALLARTSAQALLRLRHPSTVDTWLRILENGPMPSRMAAVEALSVLGGDAAADALVRVALGTARDEVDLRLAATRALARWPVQESLPFLIALLEGQPGVRKIAHAMLQARTGKQMQPNPEQWQQWWLEYGRFGLIGPSEDEIAARPKPLFDLETWEDPNAPAPGAPGERGGFLQRLGIGRRRAPEPPAGETQENAPAPPIPAP